MADKTQAEGDDYRPQHTARRRMDDAGRHDNREARPERKRKRASADCHDRNRSDELRRTHGVDQRAAGHLRSQRNQSSGGEHKTDIELRPLVRGEIDRQDAEEESDLEGDPPDQEAGPGGERE